MCASSSDDDAACRLSTEMRVCVLSAVTGFVRPVSLYERTVAVRVAPVPCSSSPAGLPPPRAGVARGGGCGFGTHALSLSETSHFGVVAPKDNAFLLVDAARVDGEGGDHASRLHRAQW